MIDTQTQLTWIASTKQNSVTVMTGIKYASNVVKIFNNITFLYDPNWSYEAGNPTYPISFFYVKSMTESHSSDISTKPLLFYNSESSASDGTKAGLLNIISDNIVTKPKVYKLDVLIPANASTFNNASFGTYSMLNIFSFLCSKNYSGDKINNPIIAGVNQIASVGLSIIKTLLKGLYGTTISANSICNMLLEQQDYNKSSIEYMWRNRRILKLKLWNGWKFKYLVIQDFEVTKTGENGEFYEGSLTCQEVPILTFRQQKQSTLGFMSSISSFLGNKQKKVVDTFITAMTATIGE